MTETASFTAVAHFGQPASSSSTTTTAGFPGKALQVPPTSNNANSGPSLSLHSHRQNNNSSKLPSFRYADIKHGAAALSSLLPLAQGPTSSSAAANPLSDASPSLSPDAVAKGDHHRTPTAAAIITPAESITTTPHPSRALQAADQTDSPLRRNLRSRASSYQTHLSPIADQHPRVRRPASFPDSLVDEGAEPSSTLSRTASTKNPARRPPASRSSHGAATSDGPPSSLSTQRRQTIDTISPSQSTPDTKPAKERTHERREFLLPKTLFPSSPADENRDPSLQRPPVSYKPPVNSSPTAQSVASTPVRVPPIRTFRSSGSRKSLGLDMNFQSRSYDTGDNYTDSNNDNTLRAIDVGRHGSGIPQPSPSASARQQATSSDDTGDVFLKIASEETSRRTVGENVPDDTRSLSRANRSIHRRPLSTIAPSYHHQTSPPPPPRLNRRLSDHQDRGGRSGRYDDDLASEVARTTAYRQLGREKAASAHPGEDTSTRTGSSNLRASPMTTRSLALQQEQNADNSPYGRRRPSVPDNTSTSTARAPAHKTPALVHGQNKTYNASPLTRSFDFQVPNAPEISHAVEGTESTSSITAPSTVWDELDDLKSRIHRLELTGKLPSTSGAAVMRASEDQPATATTTVTTMSLSPKKSGIGYHTEVVNTIPSQRDTHPHLHSALAKTKAILNPEVYRALETAANDALALSSIMGAPGQPGPISSAASVIGTGPTITDRQLRRRADSVCRSLTELCIALGEGSARTAAAQPSPLNPASQSEGPIVPSIITKSLGGISTSRRPSIVAEQTQQMTLSPRPMSKFEERRSMILNGGNMPTPRHQTSNPSTPNDANLNLRRSSLVVARTRRAVTEEPEDGRRSSALIRSRRAGTEEPDEGRKTSFLVRGRRGTLGEDSEEARFRAPSRATTEVNGPRGLKREYVPDPPAPKPEARAQAPSALGRRRFISNLNSSRLATPMSSSVTPTRKYSEVLAPEGSSPGGADKPAEARLSRHLSLSQHPLQNRTSSLYVRRPNRDSLIPPGSSAGADGYR